MNNQTKLTDASAISAGMFDSNDDITEIWFDTLDEDAGFDSDPREDLVTAYFDHAQAFAECADPDASDVEIESPILLGVTIDNDNVTVTLSREQATGLLGLKVIAQIEDAQCASVNGW
jgi:hypothetical protein